MGLTYDPVVPTPDEWAPFLREFIEKSIKPSTVTDLKSYIQTVIDTVITHDKYNDKYFAVGFDNEGQIYIIKKNWRNPSCFL